MRWQFDGFQRSQLGVIGLTAHESTRATKQECSTPPANAKTAVNFGCSIPFRKQKGAAAHMHPDLRTYYWQSDSDTAHQVYRY